MVHVAFDVEGGHHHLGLRLVDRGDHVVLLEVEQRRDAAQRVETPQGGGVGEVGDDVRALDLVEIAARLLRVDEGVGQQVRPFHLVFPDQHEEAVGVVLPVALVPDHRILVEAGDGIQVAVAQGVAADLHVLAEDADVAGGEQEADLGGVAGDGEGVGGRVAGQAGE